MVLLFCVAKCFPRTTSPYLSRRDGWRRGGGVVAVASWRWLSLVSIYCYSQRIKAQYVFSNGYYGGTAGYEGVTENE